MELQNVELFKDVTCASIDAMMSCFRPEVRKFKKGDTILGISKKNYGTTEMASQIIELNDLKDANKLYVGQEIKLP